MIVVDSSVWIDFLNGRGVPYVMALRAALGTIDLLIGTWWIENRRPLLHHDSDFRPMARYLGLVEVPALA